MQCRRFNSYCMKQSHNQIWQLLFFFWLKLIMDITTKWSRVENYNKLTGFIFLLSYRHRSDHPVRSQSGLASLECSNSKRRFHRWAAWDPSPPSSGRSKNCLLLLSNWTVNKLSSEKAIKCNRSFQFTELGYCS